jgi:hypothetical protein
MLWGGLHVYRPAKGLIIRTFRMPPETKRPFIVDLKASSGFKQRQQFLESWKAGRTIGLHSQVLTVEGDPLELFAIAEQGHLTLITDFTRDAHSNRSISVQHPVSVSIQQVSSIHPLQAWFPRQGEYYLGFALENGGVALF